MVIKAHSPPQKSFIMETVESESRGLKMVKTILKDYNKEI